MHILPLEHQRTTNQPARVRTCRTDSPVTATTTSTTSPRTATERRTREDNRFASLGKVRENCSSTSNLLKHRPATPTTRRRRQTTFTSLLTLDFGQRLAKERSRVDSTFFTMKERKNHSSRPNFLLNERAPNNQPTTTDEKSTNPTDRPQHNHHRHTHVVHTTLLFLL